MRRGDVVIVSAAGHGGTCTLVLSFRDQTGFSGMNIASAKVDELAQRLARLTGEDVETALRRAIEERLSRVAAPGSADRQAALRKFFDRVSRLPVRDDRPIDEIVGYGPDGLPS